MDDILSEQNHSILANYSSELLSDDFEWTVVTVLQSLIYGLGVVGAITGNALALLTFFQFRHDILKSPSHYFLANLALADFLVGVLTLPFLAVLSVTSKWYFGQTWCTLWTILHFWFCSSSVLSTLAVCVERYIGVVHPYRHLRIMNKRNILIMIVGVWVLSWVLSTLPLLIWTEPHSGQPYKCRVNLRREHVLVATIGIYHIPATVMVILYAMIYRTIASSSTAFKGDGARSGDNDGEQYRKQVRLALKLSFLVGFLILSYLPMFTAFLILGFDPTFVSLQTYALLAWLRYFNSSINPFIYAFSIPGYKIAFRQLFCGRGSKTSGGISNSMATILT